MKKILLVATLFLFAACQNISFSKIDNDKAASEEFLIQETKPTHHQFESDSLSVIEVKDVKIKVALLFPTSGKNRELGNALVNSATMALFNEDLKGNIELNLFDSGDSVESVEKAFDEIIEKGIKIVVGPVFGTQVEAIQSKALQHDVIVISLSNNQELAIDATNNGAVFLAGSLAETQVEKIVNYSIDHRKYSFAVLSPRNQYGKIINDLTKLIVRKRDAHFITSEFYDNNEKDIERAVANVVKTFAVSGHLMEGKNKLKKAAVISQRDRIYPQIIMIPDNGKNLSKIVAAIKKQNNDERDFQIVGTSQWDDVATMNDLNLLGGWFAAPENDKFRNFEKSYYNNFSKFPPRISSIAHDATLAVIEVANKKASRDEKITVKDFTSYKGEINGFAGIDGPFRFLPNGLVQRNLAILEVGNGKFDVLEEANKVFLRY